MTISSLVSRASSAYLFVGGTAMLFAADAILPAVISAFPPSAAFIGQLLAASWLSFAALNWNNRGQVLGGIYGRPLVYSNVLFYTITALGVVKPAVVPGASPWLWVIVVPCGLLALVYGVLMMRGPFDGRAA